MQKDPQSFILVIDDEPERLTAQFGPSLGHQFQASVVKPQEVEKRHLKDADLVLVDYKLEKWLERDGQPVSLKPATGLALATVLREQVDRAGEGGLTAFALHTGHLRDIRGRLPSATAEHVVARLNNLEWAFQKRGPRRHNQMGILADSVRQLPSEWPSDSTESVAVLQCLLALDNYDESSDRCWRDVQECRVPIHSSIEDGRGILFLRWLLHEILPYPTFLWEAHWVAARLGICVSDLREVLKGDNQLADELNSMRYIGILSGFMGDRWWCGALEDYVWDLAGAVGDEGEVLHKSLEKRAGMDLTPIDANPAVVCLNERFEPTGQFLSPLTAVRIRPDHWPAFADSAWMDVETLLDDPILRPLVDPLYQHHFKLRLGIE